LEQDKAAEVAFSERNYQTMDDETFDFEAHRRKRNAQLEQMEMPNLRGKIILDCGCGAGKDTAFFARMGNYAVGIDISPTAIQMARKLVLKHNIQADFVVADSEQLPFKGDCFDFAYCFWILHHFPRMEKVISEIRTVTRGTLLIAEPNGSNAVVELSQRLEDLVRPWLSSTGVDTPNEKMHPLRSYVEALREAGYKRIQITQWFGGGLPPLPKSSALLRILVYIRHILMLLAWKTFPPPLNGSDFFVMAEKS
jgi:ubiquinone/menaquinone biosynthesis C-methylase UbiE